MAYRCKVCGYDQMPHAPRDYNICPSCGVEYGVDDAFDSYEEIRDQWLLVGGPWFSDVAPYLRPSNWSAWDQLDLAGYRYNVQRPESTAVVQVVDVPVPRGFALMKLLREEIDTVAA